MPHEHRIIDCEEISIDKYGECPTHTGVATTGAAFKAAGYTTACFGKEHAGTDGIPAIGEFGSTKHSVGGMLAEGPAYDQIFTRDAIIFCRTGDEPYRRFQPRPRLPANHNDPSIESRIRQGDCMCDEWEEWGEDHW